MANSDSYSAIGIVRSSHHILHLSPSLQQVDNTFNITYNSFLNGYTKSLIPIPAIMGFLGVLSVFVFQIALFTRKCCLKCCRCMPVLSRNRDEETDSLIVRPRKSWLKWSFFVLAALTILCDQSLIVGKSKLTSGVSSSKNTIDYLTDVFNVLNNYANDLYTYGDELSADFATSYNNGCSASQYLLDGIPTYEEYVDEYANYVSPVPDHFNDVSNNIQTYGITYQNYWVWCLYGLVVITVALYGIGYFIKSQCLMRCTVALSDLLLLSFFALFAAQMIIIIGLGDFCMDPVRFTVPLVPLDIKNLTAYYTSCVGVNPMASIISQAENFTALYVESVDIALRSCPNDVYLSNSLQVLGEVNSALVNITAEIACPPTQSQLLDLLQTGLCTESYQGFYILWMGQYISSILLMLITIVVALLYQYFDFQAQRRRELSAFNDGLQQFDAYFLADEEGRGSLTASQTVHPPIAIPLDSVDSLIPVYMANGSVVQQS